MTVRRKEDVEDCPVFIASQLLGKKWAIPLLQTLMIGAEKNGLRYYEIQNSLSWISPKVLTSRLREFEEEGLLDRTVDSTEMPVKVSYSLTEKGLGLRDTLDALQKWGIKYHDNAAARCIGRGLVNCDSCPNLNELKQTSTPDM